MSPKATQEEIRAAHRAKSLAYHPDRNSASRAKDVSQVCVCASTAYQYVNSALCGA